MNFSKSLLETFPEFSCEFPSNSPEISCKGTGGEILDDSRGTPEGPGELLENLGRILEGYPGFSCKKSSRTLGGILQGILVKLIMEFQEDL